MKRKTIIELLEILCIDHPKCAGQSVVAYLGFKNRYVIGYNQYKSHTMQKKYSTNSDRIYLHAEINSIEKFLRHHIEIWRATMYICRISQGQLVLSAPCSGCLRAIVAFNIKHVYYSSPEGYLKLF